MELVEAAGRASEFRLHPLGFFFLQDRLGEGRMQRVHVWLPDMPGGAENDRHQHSFDIQSLVAIGRMRSELFRFEEDHDGPETEYAVGYDGQNSLLEKTGRRGHLFTIASFETVSGATYRLKAGVIHRVTVTERPCVTLVQTLERRIPIFSYGRGEEARFDRRLCNDAEATALRQHLIAAGD